MTKTSTIKPLGSETQQLIQDVANANNTTIISFIAPQAVRTSPVTYLSASIEENEMYRLEEIVKNATDKQATNSLHFVIHTPGGEMFAAYKIASFLRSKFRKICAFVPYEAASGGTVLCCAADEVYIGELGNLTSIDPQIWYKDHRVSCYAYVRAVESIEESYGEMSPDELPNPWQQMAEKLDPVIYDEMNTTHLTATTCASRLLRNSGYTQDQAWKIAFRLSRNYYSHVFPFFAKDAEEIGFTIKTDNDTMVKYGRLVSIRREEKFPRHAIDAFFPRPLEQPHHETQESR